jgi:hypothetical protein
MTDGLSFKWVEERERKEFKSNPSSLPSSVEKVYEEEFLTAPLTFILPRRRREEKEEKILKDPLTLALSHGGERDRKKEKPCKDLNEFLT